MIFSLVSRTYSSCELALSETGAIAVEVEELSPLVAADWSRELPIARVLTITAMLPTPRLIASGSKAGNKR